MQIYGAKWIFAISILIPSFLTVLIPIAATKSYISILILRLFIGLFESASFPAVYYFFPLWVPIKEKSIYIPLVFSGMYFGTIFGFLFSGLLVNSDIIVFNIHIGHWQSIFYIFGFIGIIWFPCWSYYAYESPEAHKYITREEIDIIREGNNKYVLLL